MGDLYLSPECLRLPPSAELEEPSLVRGSVVGDGPRTVYFHGHYDVVPAQRQTQFEPVRREGRIVGRGAADMKGGLVSMLYGAAALRECVPELAGRVVMHWVPDEETGSTTGSGFLTREGLIDPAAVAMLTAEPTGGVVWHASRGAITLRVFVAGREAHAGLAHEGVNAFEAMLDIAGPLRELAAELRGRRTAHALPSEDARGSMMVVGGAAASGAGFNVVPGSAWFSVDRRFNPEEDLHQEVERLIETIERAAARSGAEVSVEVLQRQPAAATDTSHPLAVLLSDTIERVEGRAATFELCPGVLETRWYAQLGIPALAYGPGGLDVSHGPDEFLDEAAMRRCALVYALTAEALLAP
jgi:acetylornithine deacetylase/succinyl-diaminopimelate desuccinylase-like protein